MRNSKLYNITFLGPGPQRNTLGSTRQLNRSEGKINIPRKLDLTSRESCSNLNENPWG